MKGKLPPPPSAAGQFGRAWDFQVWLIAGFVGLLVQPMPAAVETDLRRDATVVAVEQVMPSVVNIATARPVPINEMMRRYLDAMRRFYPNNKIPEEAEKKIGSGVIIDEGGDDGYILTNNHVIEDATRIQVQLWDGREYEAQRLLWTSQKDLALLKIVRRSGDKPFQAIRLAKDDDLLLGETVITVGNPFGLGGSVSRGILSSKNRRTMSGNQRLDFPDWLQTDAAINPGNSGGPLINLRGELIGINVATYGQEQNMGLGFAIPVKQISDALSDFFTLEWTASLWFGARLRGAPYPLTVREVQPGSPAERAGLSIGQEIVAVNGKSVRGLEGFNRVMAANGERRANLTVLENGARRILQAEFIPMADHLQDLLQRQLGLNAQILTGTNAVQYQLNPGDGFLVREVEKNSPAARAQIQSGFLLTALDGIPVKDLVNSANAIGKKLAGERVQLSLLVPRRVNGNLLQLQPANATLVVR